MALYRNNTIFLADTAAERRKKGEYFGAIRLVKDTPSMYNHDHIHHAWREGYFAMKDTTYRSRVSDQSDFSTIFFDQKNVVSFPLLSSSTRGAQRSRVPRNLHSIVCTASTISQNQIVRNIYIYNELNRIKPKVTRQHSIQQNELKQFKSFCNAHMQPQSHNTPIGSLSTYVTLPRLKITCDTKHSCTPVSHESIRQLSWILSGSPPAHTNPHRSQL